MNKKIKKINKKNGSIIPRFPRSKFHNNISK